MKGVLDLSRFGEGVSSFKEGSKEDLVQAEIIIYIDRLSFNKDYNSIISVL